MDIRVIHRETYLSGMLQRPYALVRDGAQIGYYETVHEAVSAWAEPDEVELDIKSPEDSAVERASIMRVMAARRLRELAASIDGGLVRVLSYSVDAELTQEPDWSTMSWRREVAFSELRIQYAKL